MPGGKQIRDRPGDVHLVLAPSLVPGAVAAHPKRSRSRRAVRSQAVVVREGGLVPIARIGKHVDPNLARPTTALLSIFGAGRRVHDQPGLRDWVPCHGAHIELE